MTDAAGAHQDAQCSRYRRDGRRCENLTSAADGWCRADGCPGYIQPVPVRDGTPDRVPWGTRRHIAETGSLPVALEIDEIHDVRVSRRARDAFRFHHRGSDAEAEIQLRTMLEDFLLRSARRVTTKGYLLLAREGYELVLSPGVDVVVGYRTAHQERTWEQVKAGVPSRYGRRSRRDVRKKRADEGEISAP